MINQVLYYNFEIFKYNDINISVNALLFIVIFIVASIIKIKYNNIFTRIIQRTLYLLILISFLRVFILQGSALKIFDFNYNSSLSYYFYNIINNPINSLNSFFMVYSHLSILLFIFFYPIYKSHLKFISFLSLTQLLIVIFNFLKLGYQVFSLYQIILYVIGYLIGYLIYKIYDLIIKR